jgi:DNA-binding transcriptional regulator PaaX
MRKPKQYKILEILKDAGTDGLQFFSLFITSPYGTSFNKFQRGLQDGKWTGDLISSHPDVYQSFSSRRAALSSLISRLVRDGLVYRDKKTIRITSKGIKVFEQWNKNPTAHTTYSIHPSSTTILFSFDIPEKRRRYRDWIRSVLIELDFIQIQKSVFVGTNQIPEQFLQDIAAARLMECIALVEIGKKGTLANKRLKNIK